MISHEREFLSIARDTWINLHSLGALVLVAVILFHVVLHWRWIWRQSKRLATSNG